MPADLGGLQIRPVTPADQAEWLRMRNALWPPEDPGEHAQAVDEYFAGTALEVLVLVAERAGAGLGGFIEIGLRPYADGCDSRPVPYIEGWWIDEDLRRRHLGGALVASAEDWAIAQGYSEIGSDCLLDNTISLQAHLALGYEEVERAIHFRKSLGVADTRS